MAQFQVDRTIDLSEALRLFEHRVSILGPEYWHVEGFVGFQFGELSPDSRPHRSILTLMQKHQNKGYPKGIHTLKDKDKDKEKDKDKDREGSREGSAEQVSWFEKIWVEFPQKGRVGKKLALRYFCSSVKNLEDAKRCAQSLERYLESKRVKDGYIQNATTWFNNWTDWENYTEAKDGTVNS